MNVGFIGGGNMAAAIMRGLVKNNWCAKDIRVYDRHFEKCDQLNQEYGVTVCKDSQTLVASSDVIVLAVKPQALEAAIAEFKINIRPEQLIISVAAGVLLEQCETWCGSKNIVRAMPNTPAAIGEGATALYCNSNVSSDHKAIVTKIFNATGVSVWLEQEAQMDAVTALSGSGPAYYFLFIENMIKAATSLGLDINMATTLAIQTAKGACIMAAEGEQSPEQLRIQVTSKRGTTEKGLQALIEGGLEEQVLAALKAAKTRSEELSRSESNA